MTLHQMDDIVRGMEPGTLFDLIVLALGPARDSEEPVMAEAEVKSE
jgi:hypothetical protein